VTAAAPLKSEKCKVKNARTAPLVSTKRKAGAALGARKIQDLDARQKAAFATPGGFARFFLGINLSAKQEAVLDSFIKTGSHVTTRCCNEAGKTTKMISSLVLWHSTVFQRRGENGGVIATSGSWSQITQQLVPALKGFSHRFPKNWEFLDREIKVDGIPNFMAFSVTDVGRAEGFHGSQENPLLAIVDEAKSVKDGIFRVIEDRCRPQRTGYFSSPGYAMGKFYDSHTAAGGFYNRHVVTVDDCPWIDRKEMERLVRKSGNGNYEDGLNDPFIRSAYFAEFMPYVVDALISLAEIEECLASPPKQAAGERRVDLDFAAGGDENTIGVRVGNKVWLEDAWSDKNTMSAVGRFVTRLEKLKRELGLRADEVFGAAAGLGKPMCDAIRQAGWEINDWFENQEAFASKNFKNAMSEAWFDGTEKIRRREVIIQDDPETKGQLCDRQSRYSSDGRRWTESKEELFKRQARDGRPNRSPDRAEVILRCMLPGVLSRSFNLSRQTERIPGTKMSLEQQDSGQNEMQVDEAVLAGMGWGAGL
jgi:phage terminase large subunit